MDNKSLKYYCEKCRTVRGPQIVMVVPDNSNGDASKAVPNEVIRVVTQKVEQTVEGSNNPPVEQTKNIKIRVLECGHPVDYYTPAFTDLNSDNLNENETSIIRRVIDKEMVGKQLKDLEQTILFHVDQYSTFLKKANKQKLQAKYAIQYLDQLREKYSKTLQDDEERIKFETKFAHIVEPKSTTQRVVERERTSTEKAADKQKAGVEAGLAAMKALLGKQGLKLDDMKGMIEKFSKKEGQ